MISVCTNKEILTMELPGYGEPQFAEDIEEAANAIRRVARDACEEVREQHGLGWERIGGFHCWRSQGARQVAGPFVHYRWSACENAAHDINEAIEAEWSRQEDRLSLVVDAEGGTDDYRPAHLDVLDTTCRPLSDKAEGSE